MKSVHIVPILSIFALMTQAEAELFTALVDLEELLSTEKEVVRTLESYLIAEEERLQKLKQLRKEYQKLYFTATKDTQSFLSNPVNAFLLVKRLTTDWKSAEDLIDGAESRALIENITQNNLRFPDEEDLSGAAIALVRLQDTYLLDTSTLAQGKIEGTKSSSELSAGDCHELGRQTYNAGDYAHTLLWMQEAYDRLEKENTKTADKVNILEYMAYSTYMLGNIRHALKLTKDILEIDHNHDRALGNLVFYKDALEKSEKEKRGEHGDNGEIPNEPDAPLFNKSSAPESSTYNKLCRGERVKSTAEESKLHCHYITNNSSFLLLQPVKEEELHLKPRIVVYHDVLSDREINVIKYLAQPRLQRATVQSSVDPGKMEIASYRISKSAWLRNDEHIVVNRISERIEEITGLELDTSEELQVVNYGIGGHYDPHYDFARKDEPRAFESLGTGNRIATWLNYMSDVDAGGATVFTNIGVSVKPKKGSAAFWYNLFESGEGDFDTRHAACPVLAGSKWVSNKWIHEKDNEFRRRCNLDPNK